MTNNIEKRVATHNSGKGARYTRSRLPVLLMYKEQVKNKSMALIREIEIKRMTKVQKEKLIESKNKIDVYRQAADDYEKATELGLTNLKRWEEGIDHHPMSERLMRFLEKHDFNDYGDHFCWKVGGDGDNGETLMYEMDAFFEMMNSIPVSH
jgi:predicted GIY-YIG superfamily endonuclease